MLINPIINQKFISHSLIINSININNILKNKFILSNTLKFLYEHNLKEHINIVNEKNILINEQLNLYNVSVNRLINIEFDKRNIKAYEYKAKSERLIHIKDNNDYIFLNKQIHYKDISLLQVLKILREQHKINNFQYKETIKRINNNKPIQEKILTFINCYYSTIKTNCVKNTLKKLKQKENNKPFIYIEKNGLKYKVILKKTFKLSHTFKNDLLVYQSYNINNIETEFNLKFNIDNQFKTLYTD